MNFKFSEGLYTLAAEQKSLEDFHSLVSVAESPGTHRSLPDLVCAHGMLLSFSRVACLETEWRRQEVKSPHLRDQVLERSVGTV